MLILVLTSCKKKLNEMDKVQVPETPVVQEQPIEKMVTPAAETVVPVEKITMESVPCKFNTECAGGSYCISEKCISLDSLVDSNCEQKCTIKDVVIETNDGKLYTLPPGKGDYTAAGAIDWTIIRTPPHCKGSAVKIPIAIFKRNYDKILGDEAIIISKGETSTVIGHPINKKIAFTITVKDIVEAC